MDLIIRVINILKEKLLQVMSELFPIVKGEKNI